MASAYVGVEASVEVARAESRAVRFAKAPSPAAASTDAPDSASAAPSGNAIPPSTIPPIPPTSAAPATDASPPAAAIGALASASASASGAASAAAAQPAADEQQHLPDAVDVICGTIAGAAGCSRKRPRDASSAPAAPAPPFILDLDHPSLAGRFQTLREMLPVLIKEAIAFAYLHSDAARQRELTLLESDPTGRETEKREIAAILHCEVKDLRKELSKPAKLPCGRRPVVVLSAESGSVERFGWVDESEWSDASLTHLLVFSGPDVAARARLDGTKQWRVSQLRSRVRAKHPATPWQLVRGTPRGISGGLLNLGNTCFLSAAMHVLAEVAEGNTISTTASYDPLLWTVAQTMDIAHSAYEPVEPFAPTALVDALPAQFADRQIGHDTLEFLTWSLTAESMRAFRDALTISVEHRLICNTCSLASAVPPEDNRYLVIPPFPSVQLAVDAATAASTTTKRCPKCADQDRVHSRMTFVGTPPPPTIILAIQRFPIGPARNMTPVSQATAFMLRHGAEGTAQQRYRIAATVNHFGDSIMHGHYTATRRGALFDDSRVCDDEWNKTAVMLIVAHAESEPHAPPPCAGGGAGPDHPPQAEGEAPIPGSRVTIAPSEWTSFLGDDGRLAVYWRCVWPETFPEVPNTLMASNTPEAGRKFVYPYVDVYRMDDNVRIARLAPGSILVVLALVIGRKSKRAGNRYHAALLAKNGKIPVPLAEFLAAMRTEPRDSSADASESSVWGYFYPLYALNKPDHDGNVALPKNYARRITATQFVRRDGKDELPDPTAERKAAAAAGGQGGGGGPVGVRPQQEGGSPAFWFQKMSSIVIGVCRWRMAEDPVDVVRSALPAPASRLVQRAGAAAAAPVSDAGGDDLSSASSDDGSSSSSGGSSRAGSSDDSGDSGDGDGGSGSGDGGRGGGSGDGGGGRSGGSGRGGGGRRGGSGGGGGGRGGGASGGGGGGRGGGAGGLAPPPPNLSSVAAEPVGIALHLPCFAMHGTRGILALLRHEKLPGIIVCVPAHVLKKAEAKADWQITGVPPPTPAGWPGVVLAWDADVVPVVDAAEAGGKAGSAGHRIAGAGNIRLRPAVTALSGRISMMRDPRRAIPFIGDPNPAHSIGHPGAHHPGRYVGAGAADGLGPDRDRADASGSAVGSIHPSHSASNVLPGQHTWRPHMYDVKPDDARTSCCDHKGCTGTVDRKPALHAHALMAPSGGTHMHTCTGMTTAAHYHAAHRTFSPSPPDRFPPGARSSGKVALDQLEVGPLKASAKAFEELNDAAGKLGKHAVQVANDLVSTANTVATNAAAAADKSAATANTVAANAATTAERLGVAAKKVADAGASLGEKGAAIALEGVRTGAAVSRGEQAATPPPPPPPSWQEVLRQAEVSDQGVRTLEALDLSSEAVQTAASDPIKWSKLVAQLELDDKLNANAARPVLLEKCWPKQT